MADAAACLSSSLIPSGSRDHLRWDLRGQPLPPHVPLHVALGKRLREAPFMGLILEAAKGVQRDVLRRKTTWERIRRGAVLSGVLVKEVLGIFLAVPYGIHALIVYKSLARVAPDGKALSRGEGQAGPFLDRFLSAFAWLLSGLVQRVLGLLGLLLGEPARGLTLLVAPQLQGVTLLEDVPYGPAPRNVLDICLPALPGSQAIHASLGLEKGGGSTGLSSSPASVAQAAGGTSSSPGEAASSGRPVLLFVHGGVWASGEKWHYSPMAVRCAQEGVVVVTIQYTLYPEALSCRQAQEVSQALTWTLDNIAEYGGDPARVFLCGHSSGAHICALALWERACAQLRADSVKGLEGVGMDSAQASLNMDLSMGALSSDSPAPAPAPPGDRAQLRSSGSLRKVPLAEKDLRQPFCFLGLSGVYDIAKHLAYETGRGVDVLSTMTPANGGWEGFAQRSPALLLAALSALAPQKAPRQDRGGSGAEETGGCRRVLLGERNEAARRMQAALRGSLADLEALAGSFGCAVEVPTSKPTAVQGEAKPLLRRSESARQGMNEKLAELLFGLPPGQASRDAARLLERSEAHVRALFPLSVVVCSPGDVVVPPDTSVSYAAALRDLGLPYRLLAYEALGHQEFACWSMAWDMAGLPPHARDVLDILTGRGDLGGY